MNATVSVEVNEDTLFTLVAHLHQHGGTMDLAGVVDAALRQWLAAQEDSATNVAHPAPRGYQWKSLFLPDGTALRMAYRGNHEYAMVRGERLLYHGHAVSPNQFANSFADSVRNAWKDISILFPGAKQWKLAYTLRRQHRETEQAAQQASPADTRPAHGDTPPNPAPSTPRPNPQWDLPERRHFRYRLEDAAFD
jgi:hypothetical protein